MIKKQFMRKVNNSGNVIPMSSFGKFGWPVASFVECDKHKKPVKDGISYRLVKWNQEKGSALVVSSARQAWFILDAMRPWEGKSSDTNKEYFLFLTKPMDAKLALEFASYMSDKAKHGVTIKLVVESAKNGIVVKDAMGIMNAYLTNKGNVIDVNDLPKENGDIILSNIYDIFNPKCLPRSFVKKSYQDGFIGLYEEDIVYYDRANKEVPALSIQKPTFMYKLSKVLHEHKAKVVLNNVVLPYIRLKESDPIVKTIKTKVGDFVQLSKDGELFQEVRVAKPNGEFVWMAKLDKPTCTHAIYLENKKSVDRFIENKYPSKRKVSAKDFLFTSAEKVSACIYLFEDRREDILSDVLVVDEHGVAKSEEAIEIEMKNMCRVYYRWCLKELLSGNLDVITRANLNKEDIIDKLIALEAKDISKVVAALDEKLGDSEVEIELDEYFNDRY